MQRLAVSYLKTAAQHNFIIALTAALAAISPYVLYHYPVNLTLGFEVLFATFFTYSVQRLLGDEFQEIQLPAWKWGLLVISGVAILILAFFLSLIQVVLLGLAGLLSLLYAYPGIPYKSSVKSLRRIPYLKIWVIVFVWVVVICFAPLSELSVFDQGDLFISKAVFVLQQGAFIYALTIPFDIGDLKVDEPDQKTVPMILGVQRSIKLAKSALWLSFFAAGINFLFGFFDVEIVFIQLFIVMLGLRLLSLSHSIQKNEFYLVKIDGLIALQALLFLLSYFI